MSLISRKIAAFAKKVASLPPKPGGTMPVADLQAHFDAAPEELRAALNGAIDDIIADYATKSELNGLVLGQVPNGSITEPKLDTALAQKVNGGLVNFLSRQAVVNGNFDIWQTGTSFTTDGYSADQWRTFTYADGGTLPTVTRSKLQLTPGDIAGAFNGYRLTFSGAGSSLGPASYGILQQPIENGTRYLCGAGKKVTLSFWARSSIVGKRLGISVIQGYGSGGSPTSGEALNGTNFTLTSNWTKYNVTVNTNTLVGKTFGTNNDDALFIEMYFAWNSARQGGVGATTPESFGGAGTVDIAQVQFCAGDYALLHQPRSYDDELRLCRRYCQVITDPTNTNFTVGMALQGAVATTANVYVPIHSMRVSPTLAASPADWQLYSNSGTGTAVLTALSMASGMSSNELAVLSATVAAVPNSGVNMTLRSVAAGKLLIFDARL